MITYEVSTEPVGFIVYAMLDGEKLSLGAFAKAASIEILEVMKIMTLEGGFKAEPNDALAFFLFEDRAQAFILTLSDM